MCQFQFDMVDDLRAVLVEAFQAGSEYCAYAEGLRGADYPVDEVDVWVDQKIEELLKPLGRNE